MIQPLFLHTFPFEHFGEFWKVMLPHVGEEMSVSATKETLTSLGNQHVCCGAGSCKIQMFFPLFVNGEQEKQWKSKQRGQLGAAQFNVSESFRSKSFAVFQSPLDFLVSTWESHYKSTVTGRCLKRRLYLIFLHLNNFWLNFFHAKARKSRQNRLRKNYCKLP